MAERRSSCDRGFTLPELLITVVVVGLLAGSVALAFTVITRSMPPAEARADDARTLTGLTTYLPEDVGSTPPDGFVLDDPAHLTGCAGESPGLGLLHLAWANDIRSWNVDYRLEFDDDGDSKVRRYECAPGGVPVVSTLTSELPPVDVATWQPGDPPVAFEEIRDSLDRIVGVTVTVTTKAGLTASMVARSNNPDEHLEEVPTTVPPVVATTSTSTTTTTTSTSTSTTSTTTTTLPAGVTTTTAVPTTSTTTTTTTTTSTTTTVPPCVVTNLVADPTDPTNNRGNSGKTMATLIDHVHVTATFSGSCTDLVLEFDPDLSDGTYDPQWLSYGPSDMVTIEAHPAGVQWSDGTHFLTLRNGIGNLALRQIALEVS